MLAANIPFVAKTDATSALKITGSRSLQIKAVNDLAEIELPTAGNRG